MHLHIQAAHTKLNTLPVYLHLLVQTRLASTFNSNPHLAFPSHARPTPHQIFNLPLNASQEDIKARYYELVRIHHPDSVLCRDISPSARHSRFQAITAAYETLRRKGGSQTLDPLQAELRRRQRWQAQRRHAGFDYDFSSSNGDAWTASPDDRWKDRVLLTVGGLSLFVAIGPMVLAPFAAERRHMAAAANLAEARNEAREYGLERRREIRKRVREYQLQKEADEKGGESCMNAGLGRDVSD